VVLLYLNDATLGFLTDTSAIRVMFTPGLGVVPLLSSNLVIVKLFIVMTGSLTRKTVKRKTMIAVTRMTNMAVTNTQHLTHFLLRFLWCLEAPSSSLHRRSAAGASGLTCSRFAIWLEVGRV